MVGYDRSIDTGMCYGDSSRRAQDQVQSKVHKVPWNMC